MRTDPSLDGYGTGVTLAGTWSSGGGQRRVLHLAGVLVPLCFALGAVKNRPDRLLARGVASGDVEELLGGSWALTSQLVN